MIRTRMHLKDSRLDAFSVNFPDHPISVRQPTRTNGTVPGLTPLTNSATSSAPKAAVGDACVREDSRSVTIPRLVSGTDTWTSTN